ncbi:mesoderm induction early response protein 1 [Drosophila grimshawi]|uniref:GH20595 n=1 Tax=Drosophila grimshawi TaxID=7222 RepID=B4J7W6_DROGR|nr:mesoderm induction early response protein 1 [Drosophila grimshawi]EDW01172.1 GH20595 [Drosophila grimshawi]
MAGRELTTPTPTKRERRKSPAMGYGSDNSSGGAQSQPPPMSPTSSVADTTFEPTIDMMVNDFDDEATLNEEEALADLEAHNADEEIATLREESEMPIEQLLAKYGSSMSAANFAPIRSSSTSTSSGSSTRRRRASKRQHQEAIVSTTEQSTSVEPVVAEDAVAEDEDAIPGVLLPPELTKKPHRSHLLDLYPEESFGSSVPHTITTPEDLGSFTPLQTLFEEVEQTRGEEEEEDSDTDSDDARKIIMVGPDYQAEIPEGLSQYGDILPYENEDQLIWEPSQVSEREVENYLAKIQETRSAEEGGEAATESADVEEATPAPIVAAPDITPTPTAAADAATTTTTAHSEPESVVKDNEQALHLLVQCGYDFKEALRRKRLNVLPLSSDTMSSWSEEECEKFEEGIHKYGKDFYQIRQNQVRTRTMRELVHFYYLWKKSERRDQSFALNDTIDHMDAFINEVNGNGNGNANGNGNGSGNGHGNGNGNGTGNGSGHGNGTGNGSGPGNGSCSPHASNSSSNGHNGNAVVELALEKETLRKSTAKNYSIMTGGTGNAASAAAVTSTGGSRKRGVSQEQQLEEEREKGEHENVINKSSLS